MRRWTMPVLAPLADFAGVPRAMVITAFQSASGIVNLITPTSAVVMGGLALAKVRYDQYLRFVAPLVSVCWSSARHSSQSAPHLDDETLTSSAAVWKVSRSGSGVIRNLEKTRQFVNHYSFHIMDPTWGHLTIKMSGHPPFGAQVILNGHEYVACQAQTAGINFTKEGNCFTRIGEPERLAQVADTLSQPGTIGRLGQVIDRWIYTACLCFGLDLADQQRSGFGYAYSIYQVEYSRNLIFASGAEMERTFDTVVDRTRVRLDVPRLRTLFGVAQRPRRVAGADLSPRQAVVIERPQWNLTLFKVHFGLLTLKGYTKGEHVLRFEAIVHNTKALHTGRVLEKFPETSSPAWPVCSTGSRPCSTASTSDSFPTVSSTNCP